MTKSLNRSENIYLSNEVFLSINKTTRHAIAFGNEAKKILSSHESSQSRIITIEESYTQIKKLTLKQDDLFRQSLRCIEQSLFRAAHVLAWAAFMDFMEEQLAKDQFKRLNLIKQKWNIKLIEDLREIGSDYQVLEAIRALNLYSKTEEKALKGLLNKRNECAHPSDYYPNLNETLGYISEILHRLEMLQKRWT